MQQKKRIRLRRTEILTGLMLLLVAFSFVTALLLDFKFVSPDATLQEDLAYLSEHTRNQLISSCAWLATALLTLFAIPFYLSVFHPKFRILSYLNALLMLGAVAGFLMMGWVGIKLQREMALIIDQGLDLTTDQNKYSLLSLFHAEQLYRHLGSSCVGLWAVGLSFSRIRVRSFPIVSSVLLLVSGPVLVYFNWFDPEHLARTSAMAGIIIGVLLLCMRLINRGFNNDKTSEHEG
jgi:hypothetical protein